MRLSEFLICGKDLDPLRASFLLHMGAQLIFVAYMQPMIVTIIMMTMVLMVMVMATAMMGDCLMGAYCAILD